MLSKGHKRKQQIIDTAKEMFINNGFQSTHIGNVCEILNIARGTVYQYFKNKREILYAIFDSIEENINDILDPDDLKDFLKKSSSQKAIFKFINDRLIASINPIIDEPIAIKLIFREIKGIDDGVIERVNDFLAHISKMIMIDIDEMLKRGFCKKDVRSDTTALMLIGGALFILHNHDKNLNFNPGKETIDLVIGNYLKSLLKN